jgi:hypothetical protein
VIGDVVKGAEVIFAVVRACVVKACDVNGFVVRGALVIGAVERACVVMGINVVIA